MWPFKSKIASKLREERRQHRAELQNANDDLARMQRALNRATKAIQRLEKRVPDVTVPKTKGELIYPPNDASVQRPNHQIGQYHTVGTYKIKIHLIDKPEVKGDIKFYLQENGYGDRRIAIDITGEIGARDDPEHGSWWQTAKKFRAYNLVNDWLMRAPDAEIDTPLPKNADPEDRSWEALGAEYK